MTPPRSATDPTPPRDREAAAPDADAGCYDLRRFVADMEAVLDRHPSIPRTVEEVSRLVARAVADGAPWLEPRYRRPIQDSYARYLLHRDRANRFVVLSLVWLPGQSTPVHDHSCWGVMGLIEGQLEEVHYERLDDGSREHYAELRESRGAVCGQGSVAYVFPPYEEIHRIGNRLAQPALSLHVYGRDLDEVNVFDPVSGRVSPMRIKYYNPPSSALDFII